LNAKVASPEIKHYCAHTPTKTTKRTRSIFLVLTHVENAFGGCSELGGRVWNVDRQGGWIEGTPAGSFDTCSVYYVNTLYSLRYGLRRQMPSIFPTTEVIICCMTARPPHCVTVIPPFSTHCDGRTIIQQNIITSVVGNIHHVCRRKPYRRLSWLLAIIIIIVFISGSLAHKSRHTIYKHTLEHKGTDTELNFASEARTVFYLHISRRELSPNLCSSPKFNEPTYHKRSVNSFVVSLKTAKCLK